ncbi:DUF4231 domain-containing protein [Companilactobacillus pabuli]|uniref:DUF4231 domain-containing protein n=1 Tax=Companilactobacillus TaxID=2767879 RepID=UPI00241C2E95|nr:DUF4231 domain-containing protein [Companilactobacillus farciminis]
MIKNMNVDDYLKSRVEDQINWYDRKSKKQKLFYYLCQFTLSILSATITALAGIQYFTKSVSWILPLLGAASVITQSVLGFTKLQEKWIQYRTISETLKKEKYMFLTKSGTYDDSNGSFNTFVERCESIISNENINWANIASNKKKSGDK